MVYKYGPFNQQKGNDGVFSLKQHYIIIDLSKGVYRFELVSQVSDVDHGPLVTTWVCRDRGLNPDHTRQKLYTN